MEVMHTPTIDEANAVLDALAREDDFARHVAALRSLVRDGLGVADITFMMRGMFPEKLIAVLVEARHAEKEPVIEAGDPRGSEHHRNT